jgi:hypothetical protein
VWCVITCGLKRMKLVGAARQVITSQRKSVRRFAQDTGVSTSAAWTICRDDFLFPSVQMLLRLSLSEARTAIHYYPSESG